MPTVELDIRQLADEGGTAPLAPITVTDAVLDEDGNTLTDTLDTLKNGLIYNENAQINWTTYSSQGNASIARATKCTQGIKVDLSVTYTVDVPANTSFAVLPTGYRPKANYALPAFIVTSANALLCSVVIVQTDGTIYQNDTNVCRKVFIDGFIYQ